MKKLREKLSYYLGYFVGYASSKLEIFLLRVGLKRSIDVPVYKGWYVTYSREQYLKMLDKHESANT